jgi:ADP-heptose:LPS heptosyltransferase
VKVLVLRFSSIGDIVLTSPVVRCLHRQLPGVEIHYVTKKKFRSLVDHNPHIHKVHVLGSSLSELIDDLETEKFDLILDLHNNVRTGRIKMALGIASRTFFKLNWRKWLLVRFKMNRLPRTHLVLRYMATCRHLGVKYDGKGLDFFGDPETILPDTVVHRLPSAGFSVYAIGGTYTTKKLTLNKMRELFSITNEPLVLIGDNNDGLVAAEAAKGFEAKVINLCGELSIGQSALLMKDARQVITHDTGMMHIAAALGKKVLSIWGNTVPDFGMWPLFPSELQVSHDLRFEVENLSCRPCSKLGYNRCPKGHFHCMNLQNVKQLAEKLH